jgi:hypothetical protein
MAKVSEIQDQIRQAASKLVDELIAKAVEAEGKEGGPSLGNVLIRISAMDSADPMKIKASLSVSASVPALPEPTPVTPP